LAQTVYELTDEKVTLEPEVEGEHVEPFVV
jgi:hypothetical protein